MVNYRLKNKMLEVVSNQLKDNDPKFVSETFNRLVSLGHSEKDSKEMIAAVLLEEICYMLKDQENYNENNYREKLSKLPEYVLGNNNHDSDEGYGEYKDEYERDYDFEYGTDDEEDFNFDKGIQTPVVKEKLPGRNESCPCGSGKKYKKCCGK